MPAQKSVKHTLARRKKSAERKKPHFFFRRILFLAIVVVLFFWGWRLFDSFRNRVWQERTRITFVVAERDPVLYSFSPQSRELLVFRIPRSTQMEVAGGYGAFLAGNLWELGRSKGEAGELLRLSVQRSLGIPVDAWLGDGGEEFFSPRPLSRITILKEALLGSIATNLTFFDRLSLLVDVSGVPSADRRSLDLEVNKVLKKEEFLDGVDGYVVVPEQAKLFFDVLRDESVVKEGKTLIIVNATPQRGLAGKVADIVGVLGIRVVATQTDSETLEGRCIVRGRKEDLRSLSARRLLGIFRCKSEEGDPRGASSLEVLLGRDFVNNF